MYFSEFKKIDNILSKVMIENSIRYLLNYNSTVNKKIQSKTTIEYEFVKFFFSFKRNTIHIRIDRHN